MSEHADEERIRSLEGDVSREHVREVESTIQMLRSLQIRQGVEWLDAADHFGGEVLGWEVCIEPDGSPVTLVGMNGCVLSTMSEDEFREWMAGKRPDATVAKTKSACEHSAHYAYDVEGISFAEVVAWSEGGEPVFPNLIYFQKPNYTFHPDQEPIDPVATKVPQHQIPQASPSSGARRVLTLDTGKVYGQTGIEADLQHAREDHYPEDEIVRGHGPAIAHLIGKTLGDPAKSLLVDIDGSAGCLPGLLRVKHGEKTLSNKPYVRCFDTIALESALLRIDQLGIDYQVLNLSLGSMGCEGLMGEQDPIYQWLVRHSDLIVTVAAGNHEDTRPSYPAAYHTRIDRLISVGANDPASQQKASFSAYGKHVNHHAPGYWYLPGPDNTGMNWQGTSFAAPHVAAELAAAMTVDDYKSP